MPPIIPRVLHLYVLHALSYSNLVLPPENFFTQYALCSLPILRGLLRFTKVGFQTHRDRAKFLELVEKHLPSAKISPADQNLDVTVVK